MDYQGGFRGINAQLRGIALLPDNIIIYIIYNA